MVSDVKTIAHDIVGREGGYVNDPDDPGGATNYGVTIHTMRRLGLDLDGDGQVTAKDVKRLDPAQAVEIFLEHYFKKPGISGLPKSVQASVFDMYVNAGSNAVKILQRMVSEMGFDCTADGVIGPRTRAAVQQAFEAAPDHIVNAYAIERRNYYFSIADKRPASRKYARTRRGGKGGWIKRAEEFMAERYHLNTEQFRERVAQWV